MPFGPAQGSQTSTLGTGIGLAELEVPAADGAIIIGDGSGAPVEVAVFDANTIGAIRLGSSQDAIISRKAAATLHLGAADAASPVAQTFGAQGSRGGTDTNVAGASLTVRSGIGTGSAAASSVAIQTPTVGGSGTTAQTMTTRLTVATAGLTATVPHLAAQGAAPGYGFDGATTTGLACISGTPVLMAGNENVAAFSTTAWGWPANHIVGFNSSNDNANGSAVDTGLARNASGVMEVNNGSAGTLRDIKFRTALGAISQPVDTRKRVYRPNLTCSTTFLLVADTAYFCYMGFTTEAVTPKYVEFHVTTVGAGAQTAEVGLFSSTTGPNKSGLTLTKLAADGSIDDLTVGTTVKRNTSAMATAVAAGTHLWAGIRTNMAVTQPTLIGALHDFSQGQIQSTGTAGALTGTGPWTGAITASAATAIGPFLTIALD